MDELREEKRRWAERRQRAGEDFPPDWLRVEELAESAPTDEDPGAVRVRVAEPYVRALRERLFGSPEPPFTAESAGGAPVLDAAGQRWESERFERRATRNDREFDEAVRAISSGTGFDGRDVYLWILTGAPPRLPRAVLRVEGRREILPDGRTDLRRRWLVVEIHAPLTEAELKKACRRIRAAWRAAGSEPSFSAMLASARPTKKPPTQNHARVLQLHDRLPDATWAERAVVWQEETGKKITPGALAVLYHRAKTRKPQREED